MAVAALAPASGVYGRTGARWDAGTAHGTGPAVVVGHEADSAFPVPVSARTAGEPGRGPVVQDSGDTAQVSGPAQVAYAENSEAAVATYTATGLTSDPVVWSVSGDDGAVFEITGSVLAFGAVPDYEKPSDHDTDNVYEVTVTATDSSAASASIDVTVTVGDVNDPSIVVIMADDTGYEVYGSYGTTQYSTPNLDAIAAAGTRFTNMFALPACPPSRVALMTGRSNFHNYVHWASLRSSEYTFGDLFTDAGYATAIGGKWQLDGEHPLGSGKRAGAGFDTHCLWNTRLAPYTTSRYWDPLIGCDGELIEAGEDDYAPDIFTDFHLDFIEENQNRPFFAYYPMKLAHSPEVLPPDAECDDPEDMQCIFEKMVERIDHNVGRIYDKLESLELLDNTILLFTADNGTTGFVRTSLNGETLRGGKGTTIDAGIRVPLIAWVPGQPGGRVFDDPIHIADIFPTIADAAGIEVPNPDELHGVSFWERLQGNEGTPREALFMYYFPNPYSASFDHAFRHPPTLFARDKRYKLYWPNEMYDVSADPLELHPLPEDHEESAEARRRLGVLVHDVGFFREAPYLGWAIVHSSVRGNLNAPRPRRRPVLSAATVDRTEMTLSYVGQLDKNSEPAPTDFSVSADGTATTVSTVSVSDGAVSLTLASRVRNGQAVTVDYTPGTAPIRQRRDQPTDALVAEQVQNLTPPNRAPSVAGPSEATVVENSDAVVASFSATDDDDDPITLSLAGDDADLFELTDGALSFGSPPDFDNPGDRNGDNRYEVTVNASDGIVSAGRDVTVTVTDENETFTLEGDTAFSFDEKDAREVGLFRVVDDPEKGRIAWELSGSDQGDFTLVGGLLSFAEVPDFGRPADSNGDNGYRVTVGAYDGANRKSLDVTVTVVDVDEPGMVTLDALHPQVDTALTAELAEPDQGLVGLAWSWDSSPNGDADWTPITGAGSPSYTPVSADAGRYLRATASYGDTHGTGKTATAVAANPVRAAPVTNTGPEFPAAEEGIRSVAENTALDTLTGRVVGAPVEATDADDDALTYTLGGSHAASFHIDPGSGQLETKTQLDYESRSSYSVRVTATDPSNASDIIDVAIAVINVEEAGSVRLSAQFPTVGQSLTATLSDPDGGASGVVWQWYRSTSPVGGWVPIDEADSRTYRPTDADLDHHLQARAGYSDRHEPQIQESAQAATVGTVSVSTEPVRRQRSGGGGGGGGGPAAAVEIDGASYAAAGTEAVFTAAVNDGTTIRDLRWTVTGPDGFTATSDAQRLAFVAPVGGTYTVSVTVDHVSRRSLVGSVPLTVLGDIAGHQFVNEIVWLAGAGITRGCAAHSYCPGNPVTRAQMASFLARGLGLEAPGQPAGFADVDPEGSHAANIEALFAAGITTGCNAEPLQYCPGRPVTRAQMASFLARGLGLEAPGQPAGFADVDPEGSHAANIEALFASGITTGCNAEPLQYCPGRPVTRAQMAAFLYRARHLIDAVRPPGPRRA